MQDVNNSISYESVSLSESGPVCAIDLNDSIYIGLDNYALGLCCDVMVSKLVFSYVQERQVCLSF